MNVVFILADDLGWSDTTLYGATRLYETPNVERLARLGLTFTRAYTTSPLCSPTRASIMTGQTPARHGITTPACHLPQVVLTPTPTESGNPAVMATTPNTATRLKTEHVTLAESFKAAGYATGHFGKWHLGHPPYSPLEHGFDIDVPHWGGPGPAGSYVAPWKFPDFDPDTPNQHIEDRMAQEAVKFLEENQDKPFYLNYWMFSVHAPFDAKRDLIQKYRPKIRPADAQRSPTYAAMVESMDDAVGVLLDTLDRLGLAERTIVIFTSDNGGNMYNEVDGATPTSNAPLRGGKATMFEGGVRVPLIVHWPGVTAGGGRTDQLASSCDFYPTLLEMLQLPQPEHQVFDGVSLVDALRGQAIERAIHCYFPHSPPVPDWIPPSASVIRGNWKLIRIFHGTRSESQTAHRYLLFDLAEDVGEQHNVAASHPQVVQQLDALLEEHLRQTNAVRPNVNPKFDPDQYNPKQEGQPRARSSKRPNKTNSGKKSTNKKAVAGWRPNQHCDARTTEGVLRITSTGNDPYLVHPLARPLPAGAYQVKLRYESHVQGQGQWFWQEQGIRPPFFRDRSVRFDLVHDGESHETSLRFTAAKPIVSLRLDPGQSPGSFTLKQLQVVAENGGQSYELRLK